MDIMTLAAKLTLDSGAYEKGLKRAEGGMARLGKTLSAKTVALGTFAGNMLTKATSAAFQALSNVVRSATDAYASYEQLTGGISTLFGTKEINNAKDYAKQIGLISEKVDKAGKTITTVNKKMAKTIFGDKTGKVIGKMTADEIAQRAYEQAEQAQKDAMDNAAKAYKSAGLSMNAYMDTATSLAASMNQATGGDTQKSASLIDMAIRDMADNANKMGTDMASVENAYRGFAKGNYTMLDNLKLGYGGTKTEMQRLLKDAAAITGEKYQMGNLADMVKAINAIQKQQGITGTTKQEAEGTIEGSKKMLSAAWENVLTALAAPDDLDLRGALSSLTDSAKKYLKNLFPVVSNIMDGLGSFMEQVLPDVVEKIPELLADFVPKLVKAGGKMVEGLGKGLKKAFRKIKWPTWTDVRSAVGKAWGTITKGFDGLGKLIFGENADGTTKWPTWETVGAFVTAAWEGIKKGFHSLGKLIFGENADGTTKWPTWETVSTFVSGAWDGIKEGFSNLGKLIFGENADGSTKWPTWETVKESVTSAWDTICKEAGKLKGFVFGDTADAADIFSTFVDNFTKLKNTVEQGAIDIGTWFFGEENAETVVTAVKEISTAIEAIGAAILGIKVTEGITSFIGLFKEGGEFAKIFGKGGTLATFLSTNKIGLIIGAIAIALVEIIEHWDQIEPALKEFGGWIDQYVLEPIRQVGEWIDTNIIKPIENVIAEFKKTFGLDIPTEQHNGENGTLSQGQSDNLKWSLKNTPWKDDLGKTNYDTFLNDLQTDMQAAGYSGEQIEDALEAVKQKLAEGDTGWVEEFLSSMTDAQSECDKIKEVLTELTSEDWEINVKLKQDGEASETKGTPVYKDRRRTPTLPGHEEGANAAEQQQQLQQELARTGSAGTSAGTNVKNGMNEAQSATSKVREQLELAAAALESLKGEHDITLNLNTNGGGGLLGGGDNGNLIFPGNAKGVPTVPYDDYLTRLHRGEMVLTKSQARQYREGGSGGGVDISGLAASIVAAVREGMAGASVNSYLDGKGVTDNVNRRTSNKLRARRFSMA